MNSLFKKDLKDSKSVELSTTRNYFIFLQDQCAKKMSSMTSRLSKNQLHIVLGLFVVTTGGGYICIVWNSFSNTSTGSIIIGTNSKPTDILEKSHTSTSRPFPSNQREQKEINKFRINWDSLAGSPTEKKTVDSIAGN